MLRLPFRILKKILYNKKCTVQKNNNCYKSGDDKNQTKKPCKC